MEYQSKPNLLMVNHPKSIQFSKQRKKKKGEEKDDEPASKIGGDADVCFDRFVCRENEINGPGFGSRDLRVFLRRRR